MNAREIIKLIEKTGTRISKEKLLAVIKFLPWRDYAFAKDPVTGYSVVIVKLD